MTAPEHQNKQPTLQTGGTPLPPLTDRDFQRFRGYLYRQSGIALRPSQKIMVQNRLRQRVGALGFSTWGDYYAYLTGHRDEVAAFLDALTTHETYFMREDLHWRFLRETLVPRILRRRSGSDRHVAVWSAAASSGEELYSAGIILAETLPTVSEWDLRLVGTDISISMIRRAGEGIYTEHALRALDPPLRKKYFTPLRDEYGRPAWRISPWLRERCRFDVHNLKQPFPEQGFDLVLCRNVFIYFDQAAKRHALDLLVPTLSPEGYICFSHTDAPIPEVQTLGLVQPSIYQKQAE